MEGFTIIDAVVAAVIVLSAILAYSRGLVREVMAIAGWIGAAVAAFVFAPAAQPLIKEIPVLGDFLGDSCELSIIAAFAVVFALGLVLLSLFTPLFSSAIRNSALGGLDQSLGFLFGVLRGVVLVAVALIVYDRAVASDTIPMVDNSRAAKVFASFQQNIDASIPSDAPGWIVARYEQLVSTCTAPAEPAPVTPTPN
ncbi:membrane protein required for colicin V production [Cereibacter ovatus]|uniref:Membrane protein required for colicin V production n=1 Tax=Cereibacter ovatus TaxID=439529 RepID=A0A285CNI1_9RHOB|nr:CvpA family protein [Cereibacter ovatus]SNX69071.1 membrane protein required for colicin V production [Cereibacter ovatus]